MLSEKLLNALNKQVNAELYSAYLYLSMASYFDALGLNGYATWMKVQAQEELTHAMRFYRYINDRGGKVALSAIDGPPTEWSSPLAAVEALREHEAHVTQLINKIVDIAVEEHDHTTNNALQWFVTEQIEEEASAEDLVNKTKLVGKDLYLLDKELGTRTFVMPPAEGA